MFVVKWLRMSNRSFSYRKKIDVNLFKLFILILIQVNLCKKESSLVLARWKVLQKRQPAVGEALKGRDAVVVQMQLPQKDLVVETGGLMQKHAVSYYTVVTLWG